MSAPAMPFVEFTQDCINAAHGRWPGVEPGSKRKDRPVAIAVFKNRVLEEVFGRAHWVTPIFWFGPVIAYGLYGGLTDARVGPVRTAGLYVFGWLIWTLIEYVLHRYLFHLEARRPEDRLRQFLFHGYHHDFPDDKLRLVAPPMMSWPPGLIVALAYYLILGKHYWAPVMAGTASGYVAYDWIHYYTHHGRPKRGLGKWLRRYHMKHHFQDGHAWYGVSSPLWDLVFGTYKSRKVVSTAPESSEI